MAPIVTTFFSLIEDGVILFVSYIMFICLTHAKLELLKQGWLHISYNVVILLYNLCCNHINCYITRQNL